MSKDLTLNLIQFNILRVYIHKKCLEMKSFGITKIPKNYEIFIYKLNSFFHSENFQRIDLNILN